MTVTLRREFDLGARIVQTFEQLADIDHLEAASRAAPYRHGYAIQSWKTNLLQVIQRNMYAWTVEERSGQVKHRKESPVSQIPVATGFASQVLTYITVTDARELAHFEPPDAADVERLVLEPAASLPPTGMPISRAMGGAILEAAILLCVMYYWLLHREHRLYGAQETPATLFTVFRRTRTSRFFFVIIALVPAYAVIHLASLRVRADWGLPLKTLDVATAVLVPVLCVAILRASEPRVDEWGGRLWKWWRHWRSRFRRRSRRLAG